MSATSCGESALPSDSGMSETGLATSDSISLRSTVCVLPSCCLSVTLDAVSAVSSPVNTCPPVVRSV